MESERPEPPGTTQAGTRLGGARADFVGSLGRKVAEARSLLASLEHDSAARAPRDELRRRLHALGAAARMLHFDAMARCIADGCAVLDRVAQVGTATETDLGHLSQTLDDLPALAWEEGPPREGAGDAVASTPSLPASAISALVVGDEAVAEGLSEEGDSIIECERTELAPAALGMARTLAPDVVIVDADLEGALDLVESLLDDPLTEPVPIIVIGSFPAPEQAARYIALGVAKALAKPVPPSALRNACQEVIDQREGRTVRITLGEPTLEQLGERLADEVRRALVDSVDGPARSCRVPLGEGAEVIGAIWGAIARVREVVTMRTDGVVRFAGGAPEGAVALAPWLHQEVAASDRARPRRGADDDVRLVGRRVIVADDDPGVTWFIADLLRASGCTVHEALDGKSALELAFKTSPELVVSDILMPGLDGFALCRALKRDVALRDVPVILLSWKEDLLQRVRELGASAAAYLRKESDARAVVARVREVLRPRARVEARLRTEGEVRGRLDGLTMRSLLELVCALRPSSRISVRDASFLYEVEIRDGAPRRATRTAGDGSFSRGERVLAAVLGIGAGRFTVAPSVAKLPSTDLTGTLAEQLARPIACAREALGATTGAKMMNVDRVLLDGDAIAGYLLATPEHERNIIKRIAQGSSPREMLLKGEIAPALLEDVMADLASRGAITTVRDARGNDVLAPAVERALNAVPHVEPGPTSTRRTPSPLPSSELVARELPAISAASQPGKPASAPGRADRDSSPPSSLEDAVMRAMSDRSPAAARVHSSEQPPIVEPSQLRPRSSNPPAGESGKQPAASIPPDAVVPGNSSGDMPAARAVAGADETREAEQQAATPTQPFRPEDASIPVSVEPSERLQPSSTSQVARPVVATTSPATHPRERRWRFLAVLLPLLVVVLVGIRWVTPMRAQPFTSAGGEPASIPTSSGAALQTFTDLPSDEVLPQGDGVLDLRVADNAALSVDGVEFRPPHEGGHVRLKLQAGIHEVKLGSGAQELLRVAEVRPGRATLIDLSQSP